MIFFIVSVTVQPCFADDEGGGGSSSFGPVVVNELTQQVFVENFFPADFDFEEFVDSNSEFIIQLRQHVSDYPDEDFQMINFSYDTVRFFCMRDSSYVNDDADYYSFTNSNNDYHYDDIQIYSEVSTSNYVDTLSYYQSKYMFTFGMNNASFRCFNNYDAYLNCCKYNSDCTANIYYYSGNVLHLFLDYLDSLHYQDLLYDVTGVGDNFLLFYDCFDSYKGKYNYEFFDNDRFKNYLNSSVTFDDDVFYTSTVDNVATINYQHKERLTFYVKINSDDNYSLSYNLNAQDGTSMDDSDIADWIQTYLINHTTCKHYENGPVSFVSWYSHVNSYWFNGSVNFQLHKIATGNHSNVASEWQYYIKFYMPNSYSYAEGENTIFIGSRTVSNAVLFNSSTGKLSAGGNGVGSRIDEADVGTMKPKSELLQNGWKNGYPNTSGSYPYYIKMTCNGEEFLYFYFKEKPNVKSYFYTDNQIKYTVDMNNAVGYVYQPQYNISNQFDFSTEKIDELNSTNISLQQIADAVDVGADVTSLVSSSIGVSPIVSFFFDVFRVWQSYEIDILQSALNLNIVLWTNYTGTISNGLGNIRGYYCQFNWNVDGDRSFIRDNSDDNHDYSLDVIHDIPMTQEIPTEIVTDSSGNIISSFNNYTYNYYYTDNNGYIHGGGDDTYIATEAPTHLSEISFSGNTYDFATDLLGTSSNYLGFLKSALSFFPAWIWSLVGLGLSIVIFLRILGR